MTVPASAVPPVTHRRHLQRVLAFAIAALVAVAGIALAVVLLTSGGSESIDRAPVLLPGKGSQVDTCLNTVGRPHC